jgi:hypothetical protein
MPPNESAGLILKIFGDSKDAHEAVEKFKKDLKGLDAESKNQLSTSQKLAASSGLTAQQFQNVKVGALAAVAGVAALTAAATAAVLALYKLTSSAAEYGSQIYDASVKTGLTTETLSTLRVTAERTGVSVEAMGTSIFKFSRTVGEAAQGSVEAKEALIRLGVDPQEAINDLDGTLAKVFAKIQSLPDPISKATLAQQAFGRSGKDLLLVIEDMAGDLPGAIDKARELGLVLSKEDAKAADDFSDQMALLNLQLGAVGRMIGTKVMPTFMQFSQEVSDWLKNNKDQVETWAFGIAAAFSNATNWVRVFVNFIKDNEYERRLALTLGGPLGAGIGAALDNLQRQIEERKRQAAAQATQTTSPVLDLRGLTPEQQKEQQQKFNRQNVAGGTGDALTDFDAAKKRADDLEKKVEEARRKRDEILEKQRSGQLGQLAELQKEEEHVLEVTTAALRAQLEKRDITSKQFLEARLKNEEDFAKESLSHIDAEFELKKKQGGLEAEQLLALEMENNNARQKIVDTRLERELEAKKEAAEADNKLTEEQLEARRDKMEKSIAIEESELGVRLAHAVRYAEDEKKTAEDLIRFEESLAVGFTEFKINKLKEYAGHLVKDSKEHKDTITQITILENKLEEQRTNNHIEDKKRHAERIKNWNEYIQKVYETQAAEDARTTRSEREGDEEGGLGGILGGFLGGFGGPGGFGDFSIWDQITDAAGNTSSVLKDTAEVVSDAWSTAGSVVGDALGQMASGLANMLAAWLSGADVSGKALLQMTSQIALQLAAQAGIEAIMETARGFAALAITWGVPNPKSVAHFAAAGVFATVAGIAGAVGVAAGLGARALGGGSAKQSATGTSTGGTSSRRSNTGGEQGEGYSAYGDKAYLYEEGRTAPLGVSVEISFKDKPEWFDNMFEAKWRSNGKIRRIVEDGR